MVALNLAYIGEAGDSPWRPFTMPPFLAAFTRAALSSGGLHCATLYDLIVGFDLGDLSYSKLVFRKTERLIQKIDQFSRKMLDKHFSFSNFKN
jgi:hypothetical protein